MFDFSPDVLVWKQLLLPKFGGWTKDCLCAFSEILNSLYTCHHQLSAYFSRKYLLDLVCEIRNTKYWTATVSSRDRAMRLITATTHGIGSILQHKKYVELLNWSTLPQHNQTINEYRSSSGLGHYFQWWNQRGPGNVAILFRIENPGENPAWYLRL